MPLHDKNQLYVMPFMRILIYILIDIAIESANVCVAQTLADDHIAANVPSNANFAQFIIRDLSIWFKNKTNETPDVKWSLLRDDPTQTGISYPKYYVWARFKFGKHSQHGALRLAAVQQDHFEVTDWMPREEILKNPEKVGKIFPASLIDAIIERA